MTSVRYCGLRRELYFSPNIYQIGLGVCLISVSAFFLGLVLAYSFRIESQGSWRSFQVPMFLWISTLILAASSALLETARYALRRAMIAAYRSRVRACILLGLGFVSLQAVAAFDLAGQGVATAANPHGSAFYVFIAIHGVHLLGGLGWLIYLELRSRRLFTASENTLRKHRIVASVAAIYWHYMGAVWGVLFFFLLRWTRS